MGNTRLTCRSDWNKLNIVDPVRDMAPYLVMLVLGLLVVAYVPWVTLVLPYLFLK